jgi:hypothetical protein
MNQDDGRDPHLLAALRHAPDRNAVPPADLSAQILAAAQAATRRSAPAAPPPRTLRQRVDAWLGGPRAPWAAVFGTLTLGVMVGLMWSTLAPPLPPSVPLEAAPQTQAEVPPSEPPTRPALARSDVPGESKDQSVRAKATLPPLRQEPASAKSATMPAAPAPAAEAFGRMAGGGEASGAASATLDERRRVAEDTATTAATKATAAAAPALGDRLTRERGAPAASFAATADVVARIDALLNGAAGELQWSAAGLTRSHGPQQQQWWAAVRGATQGRWQLMEPGPRVALATPWLVLSVADREVAALWIDPGGALMLRHGGTLWRAPASEAQLRDWQEAVARW